jgi:hypothetical protein
MSTWIQRADYSSQDIADLNSLSAFVDYFDSLEISALDEEMSRLETSGSEFCQWGIGINMDSDHGIHICREDPGKNTFTVFHKKIVKTKALGFIPISKDTGSVEESLTHEAMKQAVADYYKTIPAGI